MPTFLRGKLALQHGLGSNLPLTFCGKNATCVSVSDHFVEAFFLYCCELFARSVSFCKSFFVSFYVCLRLVYLSRT